MEFRAGCREGCRIPFLGFESGWGSKATGEFSRDRTNRREAMDIDKMESIPLDLEDGVELNTAQDKARESAQEGDADLRLIAWYDRDRGTGGPGEACAGEVPKCVRDYASSHGAEKRVWVNDGKYEFYFSPTGKDVVELDKEWAIRVHKDAGTSEFDNVQGG
jgi:hypothetical protein